MVSKDAVGGNTPHRLSEKWAPYRDPQTGEVVTITWAQVAAVLHAMRIVDEVRASQGRMHKGYAQPVKCPPLSHDVPYKSRALGRLLIEGKPLYEDMPPFELGAAAYWVWDAENDEAMREANDADLRDALHSGRDRTPS